MKIIVTGEINSGKTSYVKDYIEKHKEYNFFGWLTFKLRKELSPQYDIAFIEKSSIIKIFPFIRYNKIFKNWEKFRNFYFNRFIFEEQKKIIRKYLNNYNKDKNVFVIDEIGPLELIEKSGIYPAFGDIAQIKNLLVVVRKTMLSNFFRIFGDEKWIIEEK